MSLRLQEVIAATGRITSCPQVSSFP